MNLYNIYTESALVKAERDKLSDSSFGLPKTRQYPLHDAEHVRKAIQMFGHCPEKDRKELADNIYKAAKEFSVVISEKSLVFKYLSDKQKDEVIARNKKQKELNESLPFLDFVDFYQLPLNEENIEKYAPYYTKLSTLQETPDKKGLLLVDKNDQVAGFIQVNTKTGYLHGLEVNPIYEKQGLGSKLLNSSIGRMGSIVSLTSSKDKEINFFKKNGFVKEDSSNEYSTVLTRKVSNVNEDSGFMFSGDTLTMSGILDEKIEKAIEALENHDDIVTRLESYLDGLTEASVAGVACVAPLAGQTIRKPFLTDTIYPKIDKVKSCPNMFDYDEFYEPEESIFVCSEDTHTTTFDRTSPVDVTRNVPDKNSNSSSSIRKPQAMMVKEENTTDHERRIATSGDFDKYRNKALDGCQYTACPDCGCANIRVVLAGEPVYKCGNCDKYLGVVPFKEDSGVLGAILWDIIKFIVKLPFKIGMFIAKKIKNSDPHKISKAIKAYRKIYDNCLDISKIADNYKEISLQKLCKELNVSSVKIDKLNPDSIVKVTAWYKGRRLISYFIEILENKNSTEYEYLLGIVDSEYAKEPTKTLLCAIMEYTTNSYGKYLKRVNTILRKHKKRLLEDAMLFENLEIDATAAPNSKIVDYSDQSTDIITGIDRYTNHKDENGCFYITLNANEKEDEARKLSVLPFINEDMFISADFHLNHKNRNSANLANILVSEINSKVPVNGTLMILGDLGNKGDANQKKYISDFIKRLNVSRKILILGNHDNLSLKDYYDMGFSFVTDKLDTDRYIFSHCPVDPKNKINVHGHIHGENEYWNMPAEGHINAYITDHDYRVYTLKEYLEFYKQGRYKGKSIKKKFD